MTAYAELHCLSNFSFLRGASHPHELVRQAQALGYSALALTDECSLAGVVRAWETARQVGLPLVIGAEFVIPDAKLVLLAADHGGYSEICRLITAGRRRARKGAYRLGREDFASGAPGCEVLWVPPARDLESEAVWVHECFGERAHVAVELHRGGADRERLARLQELSRRSGLPLVASGDVHMHARGRRRLQDTLTAVRHGVTLEDAGYRLFPNGERHLRPLRALEKAYPRELLAASVALARRCAFTLDGLRYEYPHELVPAGHTATSWLRELTAQGMARRWPAGAKPEVRALVDKELKLIAQLRYEHFFLTVQDLVAYARSRGILCQGRGSAANSAVCYCLGVTEVDPARMSLLFERFISLERNEPPDIDVDFEHERREEVIQYVYAKYGRHRAALAATVICYRPRSAIRDVGKALGFSLEQVDRLAKSVAWWDDPAALAARLGKEPPLPAARGEGQGEGHGRLQCLVELVNELVDFPRHLSQHVGGFVISHRPLHELVPVENAAMAERTVIQWDKDDLESLGLLKVDCLALGMLSAIRRTLGLVSGFRGAPFGMADVPAEDPATYDMIGRGETTGVFQIESRAQMSMLPRLKPRNYYDLVIEVAIIRPGPIQGGMVHPYLRRRQGLEQVEYPSEALRQVLERTLGVPLFQEQVMQIAMVAAGFSAGEADQVRRSMAAWKRHGGLEHFRDRLMQGMAARGYLRDFAERIYQQVLGFGSYGFPESHAASFALLTYVSCWLKCHEPAAFLAGLLNSQPMGFYAPAQLVNEARRAGVVLRPADALHSDWDCTLEEADPLSPRSGERDGVRGPVVRLGLRMISRLPEAEARRIVELRRAGARFAGLDDFAHRAGLSRRALDALADAGALRGLAGHRHGARWAANGVERLPGLLAGAAAREPALALPEPAEGQEILADYRSLGLTLGRHPLALLRARLARGRVLAAADLREVPNGQRVKVAGLVTHRQRPETASGVVFATLEDETGTANLIIWPKVMERQLDAVLRARLMLVEGELQSEQGVIHVVAREIRDCSGWLGGLRAPSRDFH